MNSIPDVSKLDVVCCISRVRSDKEGKNLYVSFTVWGGVFNIIAPITLKNDFEKLLGSYVNCTFELEIFNAFDNFSKPITVLRPFKILNFSALNSKVDEVPFVDSKNNDFSMNGKK